MLIQTLQKKIQELKAKNLTNDVIKNYLKEHLQLMILEFLYGQKKYQNLIFTGGTCLRFCYGLNRLSEDLDFDTAQEINKKQLAADLKEYFNKKIQYKNLEIAIKGKNQKLYLKFPLLKELNLAQPHESDKLYVKIEIEKKHPQPPQKKTKKPAFKTEMTPVIRDNFSFFVKNYDLETLMSGKINAFLFRIFQKGKDKDSFKGRDCYDLIWYLQKGIKPNCPYLQEITGISSKEKLLELLDKKVATIREKSLKADMESLFEKKQFVNDFAKNFKLLYGKYRKSLE